MRSLAIYLAIPMCLASCMKYQFATVSSDMIENEVNEHILENDSVQIKYTFHGENCPVKILIRNKLDVPLYVNWKQSALILNGQSYAYWNDRATFNATVNGSEVDLTSQLSSTNATVNGEIIRQESIVFIPPGSFNQTELITVQDDFFRLSGRKKDHREKIYIQELPVFGFQYEYSKEDSPLQYRSFLTLSTDPLFSHVSTYENEFWVSEMFETTIPPNTYFKEKGNHNKFYTRK
jgi:hypothetical protein